MRTRTMPFYLSLAVLLGGCSSGPTTIEEVKADLSAKAAKIESYSADFEISGAMGGMEMNFAGDVKGKGSLMATTMSMEMMQQKISMKMILDASNTMWMDMDLMGMKQVTKMDMSKAAELQERMMGGAMPSGMMGMGGMGGMQNDPRFMLDNMGHSFDLTYIGKEEVDGEAVYVLEGAMKQELKDGMAEMSEEGGAMAMGVAMASAMMGAVRLKIGVHDGFVRVTEMMDDSGTPWMTMTYKNVSLNGPIDESIFNYTPPEDAVVTDATSLFDAELGDETMDDEAESAEPF